MFDKLDKRLNQLQYQITRLRQVSVRAEVAGAVSPLALAALPAAGQAGRLWFVTDVLGGALYADDGTNIRTGLPAYTVAELAALSNLSNGLLAWASDGRKVGEGIGAGTGVPVYYDETSTSWRVFSSDTAVSA